MDDFAFIWFLLAFIGGFCVHIAWDWQLKRQSLSIVRGQAGEKGRQAKIEQEGELIALISDATMEFKAAKENGEDMKTAAARILPGLLSKYPTAVMKHSKKLLKMANDGGFEGLEEYL